MQIANSNTPPKPVAPVNRSKLKNSTETFMRLVKAPLAPLAEKRVAMLSWNVWTE